MRTTPLDTSTTSSDCDHQPLCICSCPNKADRLLRSRLAFCRRPRSHCRNTDTTPGQIIPHSRRASDIYRVSERQRHCSGVDLCTGTSLS